MQASQITIPTIGKRNFLPDNLVIDSWEKIAPYFEDLKTRTINNVTELEKWLKDRSELEAVLEEDMAWRYIKMNIDTTDEQLAESFNFFITEVEPKVAPYDNDFNLKLVNSPYVDELNKEKYHIYIRGIKKQIEIFREENIPLNTKLQADAQKYGAISAKMTINYDGKELTLQQAANYLKNIDRAIREEVFHLSNNRRLEDEEQLNTLYTELIQLRNKVAQNAGFANYRDYMFAAMGRFDYKPQDCFDFHNAIAKEVVPVTNMFDQEKKQLLGVDTLKPWDTAVDPTGKAPLKPFEGGEELIDKSIQCFYKIRPFFGDCLEIMKQMKYVDLDSKKGKAPGGFNYPLHEIGVPFIYMNSVGSQRDLVTMVHEGGHAVHSFLSRDLELTGFKDAPSEVAELASMSMELLTMDYWDEFYTNPEELKRAKKEQLEKALETLPWVASIDKFQHWVYENPTHTVEERYATWTNIMKEFGSNVIDWTGNENALAALWQKQLHLYEVPFYYIEYGMAQLGAIAVWRNYKQNPTKAIDQYIEALKLGYTKSIGEIYQAAGIEFNFTQAYVKELVDFIKDELEKI
ncbi:M3 family oligoendopeptidase [Vicingus serpentipes]|uniref:M3 family oligoendopeptidase n=1 Tax=Vicingus serpentipes TaxID=1926625 RepID=A0A5C6RWK6_9FLAO|nr:M3 family oligoendopeptidase [Vicingus serpentipes]TXB66936.1 M3 family oligoendopeptidase [Vicingus serpentipes]